MAIIIAVVVAVVIAIAARKATVFFQKRVSERKQMRTENRKAALDSWKKLGATK